MTTVYEAHLSLLTDLLSPGPVSRNVFPSIAHHIATLDDAGLAHLFTTMLESQSLWHTNAPSTSSSAHASLSFDRGRDAFAAVQYGFNSRVEALKAVHGSGWKGRRKLSYTMRGTWKAIQAERRAGHPLASTVLASAVLASLHDLAAKDTGLVQPSGSIVSEAERHLVGLWSGALTHVLESGPSAANSQDDGALPAWLAAQALTGIPSERLGPLANEDFLHYAFSNIRAVFDRGQVFRTLQDDIDTTPEGLRWKPDSLSYANLSKVRSSLAFNQLGRFSRLLGKVIESDSSPAFGSMVHHQLESMLQDLIRIRRDWAACPWSEVKGDEDLHPDTRCRSEPWEILKTLLFTCTMIYSSLIALLNAMPLSPARAPSDLVLDLAGSSLQTFSQLYFVTMKFGTEGFGAYRSVWYGSLDLVVRAEPARVQQIAESFQPTASASSNDARHRETGTVARSQVTYYLNAMEQLVQTLPDNYLAQQVVPVAQPFLTDKTYEETFEAAHSVMLAIFAKRKDNAVSVSTWYRRILLNAYPGTMTIAQLRLAYSTLVGCLCDKDETEAWLCLEDLCTAIEALPASISLSAAADEGPSLKPADLANVSGDAKKGHDARTEGEKPGAEVDSLLSHPPTRLEEAFPKDETESAALETPRGHLLLVLIDQASSVSSGLLEPVLERILGFLREEASNQAGRESRKALVQVLFQVIARGMDMTKRQEAAKWYLEHRGELGLAVDPPRAKL